MEELVPGALWKGSEDEIDQAVALAQKRDPTVEASRDEASGVWTIKGGERTIEIHEIGGNKPRRTGGADYESTPQKNPKHERSKHEGEAGTYIASAPVSLAGENHHVRIKQLDSGDWVVTLCTQCARIRDLIEGAKLYFEELKGHPGREPHGKTAPKNIDEILKPLEAIQAKAVATEADAKLGKISEAELETIAETLARQLHDVVARTPSLESVLGVGSRSMIPLEQQLHIKLRTTTDEALTGGAMHASSLGAKWVETAKTHDLVATTSELSKSAIEAATQHRGQEAISDLMKKVEHDPADLRQRAGVEARQAIAEEYLDRVAQGADTILENRSSQLKGKNRKNDAELRAGNRVKEAVALARAKVKVAFDEKPLYTNANDFEASLVRLSASDRVALVKQTAADRAGVFKLKESPTVSALNNRLIFENADRSLYYSVDTQHARIEVCNSSGKHVREINFDGAETAPRDKTGDHDIRVK